MSDKRYSASDMMMTFVWLLTIVFIFLKGFGAIDWTWWWVFSPLWFSIAAYILFLIGKSFMFINRD